MKIAAVLVVAMSVAICPVFLSAQENPDAQTKDMEVPPGMEAKQVSPGVTILAPKGSRMYRTNETTFIMEGPEEYAARNVEKIDGRLEKLETETAVLRKEMDLMRIAIEGLEKAANEKKRSK